MTTEATPQQERIMTEATPQDYWLAKNALFIERNANANPDCIQAACVSGAQILVYIKGVIGYDAGHNYQRWTLQASPTVFGTHTEKYVYAAIPRPEATDKRTALVVFPSERIDVYGKNAAEEQIGSTDYYYIFLQGILTSSGDNGSINREWKQQVVTGYLSSDEAINAGPTESKWFKYSSVDDYVTFLKNLTMKAGTVFVQLFARALTIVSGGSITFEGKEGQITGITTDDTELNSTTDIVTPKYLDDHALSKQHDDRTDHDLAMKNLTVNGTADVFGNTLLRGDLAVGTAEQPQNAHVLGNLEVGVFNKGVQGAKVDFYGNAEFESIVGRSFLEVPELRYNRTTITVGNKWQTEGAGIIEKVWTLHDLPTLINSSTEGIARLKLEAGEIGAIAVDDKCQGVFHIEGIKNDPSTTDTRDGNFHFAGFKTIYFVVKEIYTATTLPAEVKALMEEGETIGEQQYFRYELRAATCASLPAENRNHWTDATHPQPTMHFAAYANATNSDRQASRLTTTTYQLHLAGMTDWTYTEQKMRLIIGWLTGFSFLQQVWDKDKGEFVQVTKELNGEGIATGNIYMWGSIDQFDRVPQLVAQQLYFRATQTSQSPEGIVVNADTHLSYALNGWQRDPITPSATDRFVWQQWLYTYSDGTYQVSEVAFHAADPTALSVVLSQNIVSVALTDWYDPSAPDDISFTLTARMLAGEKPLPITKATATYGNTEATTDNGSVQMNYTATIAPDGMTVDYHITIEGFVGVSVNGATPEDAFITFALTSAFGTATAVATIAQNREGDAGQDGADGANGMSAFNISVNPLSVALKKASEDQHFTIEVFVAQDGNRLTPQTEYEVSRPQCPSSVVLNQLDYRSDKSYLADFYVIAGSIANGNITFTVTDKHTGVVYPQTVPIAMAQDGDPGKPGADGTGILSADVMYVLASSNANPPADNAGWVTTFSQLHLAENTFVWSCTKIELTDGRTLYSGKQCLGASADFASVIEMYAVGDSSTTPPTTGWGTTFTPQKNKWLWTRNRILWTGGSSSYTDAICMGYFGQDGLDGNDGNGIVAQVSYFAATERSQIHAFTDLDEKEWSTTFPTTTDEKPYVWKCVKTTYTQANATYSTPELITTYHSGDNYNLIENAAFVDSNHMSAWDVVSQYTVVSGQTPPTDKGRIDTKNRWLQHNSYYDQCASTGDTVNYKDVLQQPIHSPANGVKKLAGGQWYTFSFWAKKLSTNIRILDQSNAYGFAERKVFLVKGTTYDLTVLGSISKEAKKNGKSLRTYIYDANWEQMAFVDIISISLFSATTQFVPKTTGFYSIQSYLYDQSEPRVGLATVVSYIVKGGDDLQTFIYPSAIDPSAKMILDGVEQDATPTDGRCGWQLSSEWKRHTLTFKTKATLPSTDQQYVLFRLPPALHEQLYSNAYICMPKLESGMFATGFIDGLSDLKGERGYTGVTVRRSEWQVGVMYRNDSEEGSVDADGHRYLDEVSITDLASGKPEWFLARPSHNGITSSEANKPTANGNDYWEPINDLRPLRTSFADIMTAFINYLQVSQVQIVDENNVPYGAFGGGKDVDYPLWFGGPTVDKAVVKFGKNGNAYIGQNFSVKSQNVNVTGNLHVNSLFLKQGDLITNGNKKYLNLDNHTGNYFVLPDNENVYLPAPTGYEGMQLTVFLGRSLNGKYSALSSEQGIFIPYYTMAEHTGVFATQSMSAKCLKSLDGLTSITLVAAKAYGAQNILVWAATAHQGIIAISDGPTPEAAYANALSMALLPDGRLISYEE